MKANEIVISKLADLLIDQKFIRHMTLNRLDKFVYDRMIRNYSGKEDKANQIARYYFFSAIMNRTSFNLDRSVISPEVLKKIRKVLIGDNFLANGNFKVPRPEHDVYKQKYESTPPSFIVLSPTQRCNLQCTGCYAASNNNTTPTLPFSIVNRIVNDVHDQFGRRFVVISGGEPFMYKSEGKTLLDLFEKHNDMFFMVYTNGTLINKEITQKLATIGNVIPAISVEGYEKETDERRGKGVYRKILAAIENLKSVGVPFFISVTATSKNVELLLDEKFYDYYFNTLGASFMWQFQFMPIGKGNGAFDLVVSPQKRIELFRFWNKLVKEDKIPLADFWNNAILSNGCIAYGNNNGYLYVDWNGNIMPCVFIPYYTDNIYDLYKENKTLADATVSEFMINGQKWRRQNFNKNLLMPCAIRDHYLNFRDNILPSNVKAENKEASDAYRSVEYRKAMDYYDKELSKLIEKI
ncbi:radical SAM/SPASM domain-containing protein [Roseimarinus sediminis]|uniref:radical SAM/SPASM domain-containing protein n=1 Tax=Roseimarinus sediminis TaxID=1610899 RepID=UPI003D1AEDF6